MDEEGYPSALDRFSRLRDILCCPITKAPLRMVATEELRPILAEGENERIPVGTVGAFISDELHRAYPLTQRVAYFLEQDSLRTNVGKQGIALTSSSMNLSDERVKQSVKDWYDRFGWTRNEHGLYNDTATFSQNRPFGYGLYELMSHVAILDRLSGGEFILDAASGPIAHPEYLAYSWYYQCRVCVDMSIVALMNAYQNLERGGFCCLADICHLPFRDDAFDGAISGYTVQHIPKSQQQLAVQELYKVIRPGAHLCILTHVRSSLGRRGLSFPLRISQKLLAALGLARKASIGSPRMKASAQPEPLYFFPRKVAWWKKVAGELSRSYSVETLRILSKREFKSLFGTSNRAAKFMRLIESAAPRLTSGLSAYCLVDIHKE